MSDGLLFSSFSSWFCIAFTPCTQKPQACTITKRPRVPKKSRVGMIF
ncbi:MAG: hypothetical protein ACO2PO_17345 [Candidatus Calescibacterium sp.]